MAKKGLEYLLSNAKRNLDVVGGIALAALLSPPGAAVAAVSAIDTKDNPFFVQARVGGNGTKVFNAYKFRTIRRSLAQTGMAQTFGTFDPRASKVARRIRQLGLDEMPQVLNVIGGSMSLVGSRPLSSSDIERNQAAAPHQWYDYFSKVRPGLVGEGQTYRHHYLDGTSKEVVARSMEMDLRYFDTATFLGDVAVVSFAPIDIIKANIAVVDNIGLAEGQCAKPE